MNVVYLEEICNWFDKTGFDFVRLDVLHYPKSLAIANLSKPVAKHIADKLKNSIFSEINQPMIDTVINVLNGAAGESCQDFIEFTKQLDLVRNEKFEQSHETIAKIIGYN
jgi:hypothetical protein